MTPKIYKEIEDKQPEPMPVKLELRKCLDENKVELIAVDKNGNWVATLIRFGASATKAQSSAKECLEADGYDTSFAEWDERGKIILK